MGTSAPSRKKKKSHREGERSSSKRNRRDGNDSVPPLPGGVLSTEYNVGRCVDFHMGTEHRAILESMSGSMLLDAIFEMSSQAASIVGYIREFGDIPGSGEVKVLLAKEQEKTVALQADLEALRKSHVEEGQRLAEVLQELTQTSSQLKEVTKGLKKAQITNSELTEECNDMKAAAVEQRLIERRLQEQTVELHTDLAVVREELRIAREKVTELDASVVNEHEEGFYKALRQAEVLLKIEKPLELGFDLEKDVYDGVLTYVGPPALGEGDATRAEVGTKDVTTEGA